MKRVLSLLVLVVLMAAPSLAQQPVPPKPPAAQDDFVPVDAPLNPQDTIPAPRLVAIAYGFIWVLFFGYIWSVRSRLSSVERELEAVGRRVNAGRK